MKKENAYPRGAAGKSWVTRWLPRCARRAWPRPEQTQLPENERVAEPTGRLQHFSPVDKTSRDYLRRTLMFLWYCHSLQFSLREPNFVDCAFEHYFEELECDGYQADMGRKSLIAWSHCFPEYQNVEFPRCKASLKGWQVKRPGGSWAPIPWLATCGVAVLLSRRHSFEMGLLTLLTFDSYWRPYEGLGIRGVDIIPPQGFAGVSYFTIETCPIEAERPSKTGIYDDAVLVGDTPGREMLTELLQELLKRHPRDKNRVFTFSMDTWRDYFMIALRFLGLHIRNLVLYSLRHGGPSHDLLYGHRTLEEARKRGNWSPTAGTLRRYEQRGHLMKEIEALSDSTRAFCLHCSANLVELMLNPPDL